MPEELAEHAKQYEDFESAQQLKCSSSALWMRIQTGGSPLRIGKQQRRSIKPFWIQWMESIKESGSSEGHARKLWPFDEV